MSSFAVMLLLSAVGCGSDAGPAERMACAHADLKGAEEALDWQLARSIDNAQINDQMDERPSAQSREARFRRAQEAWLNYRDAHCDAVYLAPVARSLEDVNEIWCRTRLTKERAAELGLPFIVD